MCDFFNAIYSVGLMQTKALIEALKYLPTYNIKAIVIENLLLLAVVNFLRVL